MCTAKGSDVRPGVPWVSASFAWQAWDNVHCQGLGCTPWRPLGLRLFCVAGVGQCGRQKLPNKWIHIYIYIYVHIIIYIYIMSMIYALQSNWLIYCFWIIIADSYSLLLIILIIDYWWFPTLYTYTAHTHVYMYIYIYHIHSLLVQQLICLLRAHPDPIF